MALQSARFRGEPRFDAIDAGDTDLYLRAGDQGDVVREVQFALLDLNYSIPDAATGFFGPQTSDAVVLFKTNDGLVPTDAVVGKGTVGRLDDYVAVPFAGRDEWLSWQSRRLPRWNFSNFSRNDRSESVDDDSTVVEVQRAHTPGSRWWIGRHRLAVGSRRSVMPLV
jgi:peptidoglycan hydrolase-like protein with peptidoglycan-binding domain